MAVILNIRGTHGSGKSYIASKLLREFTHIPIYLNLESKRPVVYPLRIKPNKWVYVIGPYETACGGCDAVQPYDRIWPLVESYANAGHVLFEGALISSCMGSIVDAMAARRDCVIAFLDTPLELCLKRIQARRAARGNTKLLNPANTQAKYDSILRQRPKMEALGLKCVTLHHRQAYSEVLKLLGAL